MEYYVRYSSLTGSGISTTVQFLSMVITRVEAYVDNNFSSLQVLILFENISMICQRVSGFVTSSPRSRRGISYGVIHELKRTFVGHVRTVGICVPYNNFGTVLTRDARAMR